MNEASTASPVQAKQKVICGVKGRGTGKPCQRPPALGRTRCHLHGGRTLKGPDHPNFKHGRYSKFLPGGLRDQYEEAVADPELLSARSEVALLQLRISELLGRLQTGECGALWSTLRKTFGSIKAALAAGDIPSVRTGLEGLASLIEKGATQEAIWFELSDAIENKTRTAQREWKRLVSLQQLLTAEQAMTLVTAIMAIVVKNCPDREARARVSGEIMALLSKPGIGLGNGQGPVSAAAEAAGLTVGASAHEGDSPADVVIEQAPAANQGTPEAVSSGGQGSLFNEEPANG